MSLNGLDNAVINQAYQAAAGDPGGWYRPRDLCTYAYADATAHRFLLKYATRDEVDIFKQGSGSVVEVKLAVAQYNEKSPLYGLVLYRRRKVLLKYLPDGTSRLLRGMLNHYSLQKQDVVDTYLSARLAVHFQSVIEKFAHDAIISFTEPSDLSDTLFSSSVSLPKSSNSVKSSNSSLEKRRLTEITEDVENTTRSDGLAVGSSSQNRDRNRSGRGHSIVSIRSGDTAKDGTIPVSNVLSGMNEQARIVASTKTNDKPRNLDKSLPATPKDSSHEAMKSGDSTVNDQFESRPSVDRRQSSQSTRPSTRNLYSAYKPRVKLASRPSLEYARAHSSGTYARSNEPRPVSTLPVGLRMPQRMAILERPQSHHTSRGPKFDSSKMPPLPFANQVISGAASERPASRAGSTTSVSTYANHTTNYADSKSSTATPEKIRLMKALQMRKKQMERRIPEEYATSQPTKLPIDHQHMNEVPVHDEMSRKLEEVSHDGHESDIMHVDPKDLINSPNTNLDPSSISTSDEASTRSTSIVAAGASSPEASAKQPEEPNNRNDHGEAAMTQIDNEGTESVQPDRVDVIHPNEDNIDTTMEGSGRQTHVAQHWSSLPSPILDEEEETRIPEDEASAEATVPQDVPLPPMDEEEKELLQTTLRGTDQHAKAPLPDGATSPPEELSPSHSQRVDRRAVHSFTMTRPSTADSIDIQNMARKAKRRGLIDPIQIVSNAELSDDNFLSDDSFMEELQSATVQQAKPILVSRSPVTSVFPNSPNSLSRRQSNEVPKLVRTRSTPGDSELSPTGEIPPPVLPNSSPKSQHEPESPEKANGSRSVSNPLDDASRGSPKHLSPASPKSFLSRRSLSISPTPGATPDSQGTLTKKTGVSSLISQRIRALERFSSPGSQPASSSPTITPSLVSVRKPSFSTPPGTANSYDMPSSAKWRGKKDAPYPTPSPSPHGNLVSEGHNSKAENAWKTPSESVSVTATIVRDATNQKPEIPSNPSEPVNMALHHSPLMVLHENASSASSKTPKKTSKSKASSVKSSSTTGPESKKEMLASPRRESLISRRSSSSRKSMDASRPLSPASSDGPASVDGTSEDKKESRSSRLFKRMSLISAVSRRSIAQALGPSVKEEPIIERHEPAIPEATPMAVDLGELNIQFPDTLVSVQHQISCFY